MVVLAVEGVEQPLLLPVGETLEPLQEHHPGPPQQVDLPASAALGLADGAPADLVDGPGEQRSTWNLSTTRGSRWRMVLA